MLDSAVNFTKLANDAIDRELASMPCECGKICPANVSVTGGRTAEIVSTPFGESFRVQEKTTCNHCGHKAKRWCSVPFNSEFLLAKG